MEKDNKIKSVVVETYAEDMARVIEDDQSGLIKKIIHGEEEHEKEKRNLSPQSRKNKLFMLIGLLFLLIGFGLLLFFLQNRKAPTVPIEERSAPIIFTDSSTSVEVTGFSKERVIQTVRNAVSATSVKQGGVEGIYSMSNKRDMGLRSFIAHIGGSFVPGNQGASNALFVSDRFLMGVVNGETKDFFMLFKMRFTGDIFDSLREWERKMFADLHGLFGMDLSFETKYLSSKSFVDSIVENKNARILYDKEDKIVMMYIFADDNSVIITDTESAAHEIMLRIAASQVGK